jgi:hypothetical protein
MRSCGFVPTCVYENSLRQGTSRTRHGSRRFASSATSTNARRYLTAVDSRIEAAQRRTDLTSDLWHEGMNLERRRDGLHLHSRLLTQANRGDLKLVRCSDKSSVDPISA